MSTHLKKANLALVLILMISLLAPSSVNAAPKGSDPYRASFTKKSPADQVSGLATTGVKLQWNAINDVFQYRYCYYSYDISNNVCDIADKSTWESSGTSTSVTLPTLTTGKTYYWQVFAKLEDNSVVYADGSLSSRWSFTIGQPTVGAGIYDNTHSNWVYYGKWATLTGTGPYKGTYKETRDIPDYATFAFTGARVKLYYTQKSGRGVMNVYMDGSTTPISINQAGDGTLIYQKLWMSDALTSGTHTIKMVYVSGGYVDIDAIEILAQADTTAPAAINLSAAPGANAGTVTLNWNAVGDDGNTAGGSAKKYFVRYSATEIVTGTDWDNATAVTNGVPTPKVRGQAESMTVMGLTPGQTYYFAVRAEDEQFNLGALSNSPAAVAYQPPPAPIGTYDDTNAGWNYNNFIATTSTGPYGGTFHYSTVVGSYAEFTFVGSQITLWFSKYSNRGNLAVYLDDNLTPLTTIDQYNATRVWQANWTSGDLGAGEHKVKLVHAGPGGKNVDVDAIEVKTYVAPPSHGIGTYDNEYAGWTYTGFVQSSPTTGPYLGTFHYSSVVGSTAEFRIDGSQITLTYTKYNNRGNLEVYVDDFLKGTINQYSETRVWLAEWTSGDLGAGTHTVRLVHAGPSGKSVDIDAIEVKTYVPPPSYGTGTYDNEHAGWTYSGFVQSSPITGPYLETFHYSSVVGSTAEFVIDGSQITLTYTKYYKYGNLEVYVDDILKGTINQYDATRVWLAEWTSGDLGAGTHMVRLVHAGPSGTIVDIDAIEIFGP